MPDTTMDALVAAAFRKPMKIQQAVAFIAPSTEPMPTALTSSSGVLQSLPANWVPLGVIQKKGGVKVSQKVSSDTDEGYNYASPVRTDITSAPITVDVAVFTQWKRKIMEIVYGLDLSAARSIATSGEVTFDLPSKPTPVACRLLLIGADGTPAAGSYLARGYYAAKVIEPPDETWDPSASLAGTVSFSPEPDSAGAVQKFYYRPEGLSADAVALGFPIAP